jgi:DnaJ-class molecular chaperone
LRRGIAAALKESPGPTLAEEDPYEPEAKTVGAEESRSREIFAWYGTMNLPPFAPLSAVRKRYRELVKIYHPDAMAGKKPGAKINSDEQIKRINAAYHNIVENSKRVRR